LDSFNPLKPEGAKTKQEKFENFIFPQDFQAADKRTFNEKKAHTKVLFSPERGYVNYEKAKGEIAISTLKVTAPSSSHREKKAMRHNIK
jgi:hypothetical protein